MPHPTDVHVGRKVREARVARGMSQELLGKSLGVSFQQVQKYEKGTNRIGSSNLWAISRSLKIPIGYFFEGLETEGATNERLLPRRTIKLANQIEEIPDQRVRNQILRLIAACSEPGEQSHA